MSKKAITTPILFFVGWVGIDLIMGKALEPSKIIGGILVATIVGLVIYIRENKRK